MNDLITQDIEISIESRRRSQDAVKFMLELDHAPSEPMEIRKLGRVRNIKQLMEMIGIKRSEDSGLYVDLTENESLSNP